MVLLFFCFQLFHQFTETIVVLYFSHFFGPNVCSSLMHFFCVQQPTVLFCDHVGGKFISFGSIGRPKPFVSFCVSVINGLLQLSKGTKFSVFLKQYFGRNVSFF